MSSEGESATEKEEQRLYELAWLKVKYTLLWNRDDISNMIHDQLGESLPSLSNEKRALLLHRALVYALQHNKVHALETLLQFQADFTYFELGAKASFVSFHRDVAEGRFDCDVVGSREAYERYHEAAMSWVELIDYRLISLE